MDELYPFCSELYSEEGEVENDLQSIPLLQTHVPKLSRCMRELCEGELTFKDCFSVLICQPFKTVKKTATTDSLFTFILETFKLAKLLVKCLKHFYKLGQLSQAQKHAVIVPYIEKGLQLSSN